MEEVLPAVSLHDLQPVRAIMVQHLLVVAVLLVASQPDLLLARVIMVRQAAAVVALLRA